MVNVEYHRHVGQSRKQDCSTRLAEAQIRRVAEALGIATANRACRSNITVSFVSNANAIIQLIATREPLIVDEVPVELRQHLLEGDAPVRWWYGTERRGKGGDRPMASVPPAVQLADGASLPSGPTSQILSQYNSRIVDTPTVRAGASLEAVANYAAVVGWLKFGLAAGKAGRVGPVSRSGAAMINLSASSFSERGVDRQMLRRASQRGG